MDIALDLATSQANTKVSQSIEIDNLFENRKVEINSDDLLDDNQIGIFYILEESIFFIL